MEPFGFGKPDPPQSPAPPADASYAREVVDDVWLLAEPIDGNDDALWRRDEHGNRIQRQDYGRHGSQFGWAISGAGSGSLKPLHCRHLDPGASPPPKPAKTTAFPTRPWSCFNPPRKTPFAVRQ